MAQEKTELDEQVKASEQKLQQSKRDIEVADRKRAAAAKELAAAATEKAELAERLAQGEQLLSEVQVELQQSKSALSKTAALLSRSEANNRALADTLAKKELALTESSSKNEQLFKVGESLLAELANGGAGRAIGLQGEPVTGLGRVTLENKVEAYREQLEQQRLAQQQAAEEAQRQVVAQRIEAHQAALLEPQKRKQEQDRVRAAQLKQQAKLDSWTQKIKSLFDNVEW
ncbi:hypothetical protein LNV08_09140 [Paucibacter sp. TC2R-5]|nr:hypothetical protein [Paucibacter sp. TC2R-5]